MKRIKMIDKDDYYIGKCSIKHCKICSVNSYNYLIQKCWSVILATCGLSVIDNTFQTSNSQRCLSLLDYRKVALSVDDYRKIWREFNQAQYHKAVGDDSSPPYCSRVILRVASERNIYLVMLVTKIERRFTH